MYEVDYQLDQLARETCSMLTQLERALAVVQHSAQSVYAGSWTGPMSNHLHDSHQHVLQRVNLLKSDLVQFKINFTTTPLKGHVRYWPWPPH